MHNTTLQPVTIQALQYFLTIWRQDPAAQNNLEICSQSIFLWNPDDPNDTSDITTLVTTAVDPSSETIDTDTLLNTFLNEEPEIDPPPTITPPKPETTPDTEVYQKVQEELTQTLTPQSNTHPNPFIGGTWKDQLTKIIRQLEDKGRTRPKQIKVIEAYLYLGILIQKQIDERQQIRELLQASQGSRKTQDIWKGATRLQQIFSIRPKELLYQTRYFTVTHVVKFTDREYQSLIRNLQSKFL
jgi:hypothetical protein